MRPALPVYSKARTAPSGKTRRSTVIVRSPSRASVRLVEKFESADPIGYSNRMSSRPVSKATSVSFDIGWSVMRASAAS